MVLPSLRTQAVVNLATRLDLDAMLHLLYTAWVSEPRTEDAEGSRLRQGEEVLQRRKRSKELLDTAAPFAVLLANQATQLAHQSMEEAARSAHTSNIPSIRQAEPLHQLYFAAHVVSYAVDVHKHGGRCKIWLPADYGATYLAAQCSARPLGGGQEKRPDDQSTTSATSAAADDVAPQLAGIHDLIYLNSACHLLSACKRSVTSSLVARLGLGRESSVATLITFQAVMCVSRALVAKRCPASQPAGIGGLTLEEAESVMHATSTMLFNDSSPSKPAPPILLSLLKEAAEQPGSPLMSAAIVLPFSSEWSLINMLQKSCIQINQILRNCAQPEEILALVLYLAKVYHSHLQNLQSFESGASFAAKRTGRFSCLSLKKGQ